LTAVRNFRIIVGMADMSPTARLADHLLAEGLRNFLLDARDDGRSWRWIARELGRRTDWEVDVSHETVRAWFPLENGEAA
jgi:hypothetical protein